MAPQSEDVSRVKREEADSLHTIAETPSAHMETEATEPRHGRKPKSRKRRRSASPKASPIPRVIGTKTRRDYPYKTPPTVTPHSVHFSMGTNNRQRIHEAIDDALDHLGPGIVHYQVHVDPVFAGDMSTTTSDLLKRVLGQTLPSRAYNKTPVPKVSGESEQGPKNEMPSHD